MALEQEPERNDLDGLFTDPKPSGDDSRTEELRAAVSAIFDTSQMTQKGVINDAQMLQLARAKIFSLKYGSDIMDALVGYLLEFSVSNKGRGRSDLRTLLEAIMHKEEKEEDSIRQRLLGG